MTQRGPFLFLVALLATAGAFFAVYRHQQFHVPLWPGLQQQVWEVEAKIEFSPQGGPVQVSLTLPPSNSGYRIINEYAASSGYGFVLDDRRGQRQARWTKRDVAGEQTLFYKLVLVPDAREKWPPPPPLEPFVRVNWDEPYRTAAKDILDSATPLSADGLTLAQQLLREINTLPRDQNVALMLDRYSLPTLFTDLLNESSVPARRVQALLLEDGRRRQALIDLVEVWQDDQWHLFDPAFGPTEESSDLLLWQTMTPSVLEVVGGTHSRVTFSIISQSRPAMTLTDSTTLEMNPRLSLESLPIEEQSMFKLILLLPVGALVVVFMRVIVGLKTSGTFMPVLIALAFLQTELIPGVASFLLVVTIGLLIRSYLSNLNLLLVARIATLVILVIAIISFVSVLSYRLGLMKGLTITFFPMIILAWTIERMSILWEEEGPRQVVVQGGGSLLVAVLAYLLMDQPLVRHLAFNFPELHLVVLAAILLLGRYTGYRLSELRRFATLKE